MAINVRRTANGWLVEIWRDRKAPREEFVFRDTDEMLDFVRELVAQ